MDNFEELKQDVNELFKMIVNLWKTERNIEDSDEICTYFPYINFFEMSFPIYKLIDSKYVLIEWDTYSFINNVLLKSDLKFEEYIKNPNYDFSIDNNPELLLAFVKSLTSIRKIKSLIKDNAEYDSELSNLRVLQDEYTDALQNSNFETVKIFGDSIIKPDNAMQTVEKVEDYETPEEDMWVVLKPDTPKDE